MYLALLVFAFCRNCFNGNVTKNISMGSLTIICVNIKHLGQSLKINIIG